MWKKLAIVFAVVAGLLATSQGVSLASSGGHKRPADPLFTTLTSDDPYHVFLALAFSNVQLQQGHPVTIFITDRGALIFDKANAEKYRDQLPILAELLKNKATVLVCPYSLDHFQVPQDDARALGVTITDAVSAGKAMFRPNTKILSW